MRQVESYFTDQKSRIELEHGGLPALREPPIIQTDQEKLDWRSPGELVWERLGLKGVKFGA